MQVGYVGKLYIPYISPLVYTWLALHVMRWVVDGNLTNATCIRMQALQCAYSRVQPTQAFWRQRTYAGHSAKPQLLPQLHQQLTLRSATSCKAHRDTLLLQLRTCQIALCLKKIQSLDPKP